MRPGCAVVPPLFESCFNRKQLCHIPYISGWRVTPPAAPSVHWLTSFPFRTDHTSTHFRCSLPCSPCSLFPSVLLPPRSKKSSILWDSNRRLMVSFGHFLGSKQQKNWVIDGRKVRGMWPHNLQRRNSSDRTPTRTRSSLSTNSCTWSWPM